MGNFYTNATVRIADQKAVADGLKGRAALVTPARDGCVVVFDEEADEQDLDVLADLGATLSRKFACPVLVVLNHDDDVLWFRLYARGTLIDEYNSAPALFDDDAEAAAPAGGNARVLCDAFGSTRYEEVEAVLRKSSGDDGYVFAVDRHADLVQVLNLPSFAVGCGFKYARDGELPEGLAEDDLLKSR
jgi:hypothetical protein